MAKKKSPKMIMYIAAPSIPQTEIKALQEHFKEATKDPEYTVVANHEVHVRAIPKFGAQV